MALVDTIAAIATPPGRGGIGIVKVSGPKSGSILTALCGIKPEPRVCRPVAFHDERGATLDRGLALFFQGPDSHTGEDVAEFHGHGGPVVISLLLARALALGARQARPGEFSERAFLNNKMDLLQAEAVADLINSASARAARSAARALEGRFSELTKELGQRLTELRAFAEAMLDFPEEELDAPVDKELRERERDCRRLLENMIARAEAGRTLAEGLGVALVGKPNVGKSSLLNHLAQIERAIVSPLPGTTRDTIEQQILINGIPLKVIDTAGLRRASADAVEREGMRRSRAAADQADVILLLADATDYDWEELQAVAQEFDPKKVMFVFNKLDLLDDADNAGGAVESRSRRPQGRYVSAKTGAGIAELKAALSNQVMQSDQSEDAFVAHARHVHLLREAQRMLAEATARFQQREAVELFADDLARVQRVLAELTGERVADDLLGEIFARFCIGK